ncbi:MAG TPA: AAA domain-containing protein [Dermatophilaceae bacterium]|nr:AAA domain-containing protein [Dermatophilaceae bacterium]
MSVQAEATDARAERVAQAVAAWQRHLVDLGGRNSLLWYRDLRSGTLDLTTAHPGGVAMLMAGRATKLSDLVREPAALDEARRRARTIRAKTLELKEERGISAGFLAIGMASWKVRGSTRFPAAPVLLRSCQLKPTGAAQQDFAVDLGPDVELNPVLEHYLRSEQGIEVDAEALEEMATVGGSFDPHPAFQALAGLCQSVPSFEVAPRLVVGTFSYAKLPMVADLAAQGAGLADHDVVAALAGDPDALRAVRSHLPEPTTDPDPDREHLVLDADSSQQAVVDAVRAGANLVVKGPPGTGKSQTIANLIASLAADGKRVLFVAEKRAAIDAVLGRLDRLGLSDLVLDAYDGVASKRRVAQDLGAALERGAEARDPDTAAIHRTLTHRRGVLVGHAAALHAVRDPWKVSAFDAQVALCGLRSHLSAVRIPAATLSSLSRDRMLGLADDLREAVALGAWLPGHDDDPWYAARVTSTEEATKAHEIVSRLAGGGLREVGTYLDATTATVGVPAASRVGDWGRVLGVLAQVRDTLETFRPEIYDQPLTDLVAATGSKDFRRRAAISLSWWARWQLRRQARGLLRPGRPPADLHAALALAQAQRAGWHQVAGGGGRPDTPAGLAEAEQAYAAVARDLAWLEGRLARTAEGGDLIGADLPLLRARLDRLAAAPERLAVIPRVIGAFDELRSAGLGSLLDDLATRNVAADDVPAELEAVWWASILDSVTVSDPAYGAHDGDHLRKVSQEYRQADRAHLAASVQRVRADAGERLREVLAQHPDQEALVRREAAKSRRHRPLRELLPAAGDVLTAVKPCWAMSPLVVASLLPAGRWFDVVVFDEASQIPPAQAVSAISRASQVVVAGDERQLPPTSFFTVATEEDEDGEPFTDTLTEGAESVLDVLAAALPMRRLTWHYRSLDERLVAFANAQMYDGSLVTFPGVGGAPVLTLEPVDGVGAVQAGQDAIESTIAEVDRVVELVLDHARTSPQRSLGVIALGIRHAQRVEEALRRALQSAPDVADFFDDDVAERFFVKNLERVQGDERDRIILTIGFGKTPHGRVLHRFGPLNLDGGERRLNVAITRARRQMTVVSALRAEDLDPGRLRSRGSVMLRDFLAYAATQGMQAPPTPAVVTAAQEPQPEQGVAGVPDAALDVPDAALGVPDGALDVPDAALGVPDAVTGERGAAPAGVPEVATGVNWSPEPLPSAPPAPPATVVPGPAPAALVSGLADRLRAHGLTVHEAFGSSSYPVDLAVEDPAAPGRLALAVETDGLGYRAMPSSRDRDRLRPEQLERLGWRHLRVWSTDAYRDPDGEVARLLATLGVEPLGAEPLGVEPLGVEPLGAEPTGSEDASPASAGAATDQAARRPVELAEPVRAPDDSDVGWGDLPGERDRSEWLQAQRPPHWE